MMMSTSLKDLEHSSSSSSSTLYPMKDSCSLFSPKTNLSRSNSLNSLNAMLSILPETLDEIYADDHDDDSNDSPNSGLIDVGALSTKGDIFSDSLIDELSELDTCLSSSSNHNNNNKRAHDDQQQRSAKRRRTEQTSSPQDQAQQVIVTPPTTPPSATKKILSAPSQQHEGHFNAPTLVATPSPLCHPGAASASASIAALSDIQQLEQILALSMQRTRTSRMQLQHHAVAANSMPSYAPTTASLSSMSMSMDAMSMKMRMPRFFAAQQQMQQQMQTQQMPTIGL